MKLAVATHFRVNAKSCWGMLAACGLLMGCGDKSDPEAVTIDELKPAFALSIVDQGNGTARLRWTGMNNEDGFSGYNIYGKKASGDDDKIVTEHQGKSIKLLDDEGNPLADAKTLLSTMGYNGTDWETAGQGTNADGDFEFLPYYTGTTDAPIVPSCQPAATASDGAFACTAPATDGAVSSKLNGMTWFDVTGLKAGSTYCYAVMSTLSDGDKVAQSSTQVQCITPRGKAEMSSLEISSGEHKAIDLAALKTTCGTGHSCGTPSTKDPSTGATAFCDDTTEEAVCIEYFSDKPQITAGANTGIQDLGYYAEGYDDLTLPPAPELSSFGDLQNVDGYSLAGQSLVLDANRIYVVAVGTSDNPTAFDYQWIHVKSVSNDTTNDTATLSLDIRVSQKTGQR